MSLSINNNASASSSSNLISKSNSILQKSLNRLSSGSKINSPSVDAGGLAVSIKLAAAIQRTDATSSNVSNAVSYLQSQDGGLNQSSQILNRISELKIQSNDFTKSSSDRAAYQAEFDQLKEQLGSIKDQKFNGVRLFGSESNEVLTSEDGSQSVRVTEADVESSGSGFGNILNASSLNDIGDIETINNAIQNVASLRANNGAQTNRLEFSIDQLTTNKQNLEAANSRIIDTDFAAESTRLAQAQILNQASVAGAAQANISGQTALGLLS